MMTWNDYKLIAQALYDTIGDRLWMFFASRYGLPTLSFGLAMVLIYLVSK